MKYILDMARIIYRFYLSVLFIGLPAEGDPKKSSTM